MVLGPALAGGSLGRVVSDGLAPELGLGGAAVGDPDAAVADWLGPGAVAQAPANREDTSTREMTGRRIGTAIMPSTAAHPGMSRKPVLR